ncbi:signal peptidase complex subunit 3-like isoform X3 [Malania oleifera]|uniref:signal peptidase complex subunit 3-like isoform X3 n=1 Tax=Malania oleifera TaxID=397392 RepID=UPI0025ADED3B|nr:signal peptidase complex subunit 3-like isoform X3 [Malania oleifera]
MPSCGSRTGNLLKVAALALAAISAMASLSDHFNVPSPSAHAQVEKINRFRKHRSGDDEDNYWKLKTDYTSHSGRNFLV